MPSESTEGETLSLSLPPDLGDWLDEQAAALDRDREDVLVGLVAAYRATERLEEESAGSLTTDGTDESTLEAAAAVLEDDVDRLVRDRIDAHLDEVESRIDEVQADFATDLQDVRERVVQIKRETDEKVPRERHEETLERIDGIGSRLGTLEERTATLAASLDAVEEHDDAIEDLESAVEGLADEVAGLETDLDEVGERLRTVAWVAHDLREHAESGGGLDAVDRIKRAAATLDVTRAKCESCGAGVELALLSEPACPHCEATVTNVEEASGFFGSPRLVVASQLESGEVR